MNDVLLEQVNPNGNVQAVVESTDQAVYFYLYGSPKIEFPMKSVWVRNLTPAPEALDVGSMRQGLPPANPAPFCRHPEGLSPLRSDSLRVVWLPEGNGAALYDDEELLSIIPPWSGFEGFHGYSTECVGQGPLAWELSPENVLVERFSDAADYWEQWDSQEFWPTFQSARLSYLEEQFGSHSIYYAIDGGCWPPKALIRIPQKDRSIHSTIGLSLRPQPNVDSLSEHPELIRRIELGVVLPKTWSADDERAFDSYLSAQSGLPWSHFTWFGDGHTIPCGSWKNPKYTHGLVTKSHPALNELPTDHQFGDPVNLLWFIPITENERQTAIDKGSEHLMENLPSTRWQDA
ncbi:MAG: suppressor of fused domain protein [Planctomycetaceae bacterium]